MPTDRLKVIGEPAKVSHAITVRTLIDMNTYIKERERIDRYCRIPYPPFWRHGDDRYY